MITQNKRLSAILLTVAFLLSVPLIAMQFSTEVKWNLFDFIVAGTLLTSTGLIIELVLRKVQKRSHRFALCAFILFMLFLVWAELAVGLFGSPIAGS